MKPSRAAVVRIAEAPGAPALTKEQKTFNRLTKKIADQRKQLESWQQAIVKYQALHAQKLVPLLRELNEQRKPLVRYFDQMTGSKALGRRDKMLLSEVIEDLCAAILRGGDGDDPEFLEMYEFHSGSSVEEERKEQAEVMKAMMENVFGLDLADHPEPDSPEALLQAFEEKVQAEQALRREQQEAHQAQRHAKAKPSAKVLAEETRAQEEAQGMSRSLRELYRKLVSALHPDRETDADERARKTGLIQRVNAAYDGKDLLQLLELQLQVEQVDLNAIGRIDDTKLKHYNKVLEEQVNELGLELDGMAARFHTGNPFVRVPRPTPVSVMRSLTAEVVQTQSAILDLQRDLRDFQDVKVLKDWLKWYRSQLGDDGFLMPDF